jgi:hypothetical protein
MKNFRTPKNTVLIDRFEKALKVKRSTARVYASSIGSLARKLDQSVDDLSWLKMKRLIKHVGDINNLTRRKNLAAGIIAGLKVIDERTVIEKYREILMKADRDHTAFLQSGKRGRPFRDADKEWTRIKSLWKKASTVVSAQKIFERGESVTPTQYRLLMTLIYLKFLSDLPVRRLEYTETRFVNTEPAERGNYIITHKNKPWVWSIGVYKTYKRYGKQVFVVPAGLKKILTKLRPIVKAKSVKEYLFMNTRWNQMSRDSFSKFVASIFKNYMGKKWTQNVIRSIKVSSVWKDSIKTIEALQLAESMGHDVTTALTHYRNLS